MDRARVQSAHLAKAPSKPVLKRLAPPAPDILNGA
jgi:hypothetical protein